MHGVNTDCPVQSPSCLLQPPNPLPWSVQVSTMVASGEKSPNNEFQDLSSRIDKFGISNPKWPVGSLRNSLYLSQLGSGQKAVKQALIKGLGLNPNGAPNVALHLGYQSRILLLDYLGRLPLRDSE